MKGIILATIFLSFNIIFLYSNDIPGIEKKMEKLGLINIKKLDPTILIDLKYSSNDNFLHKDLYGDLNKCYVQPETAMMLKKANRLLKEQDSTLRLLVYDGARPRSIQHKLWKIVKGTSKQGYVANPFRGSIHNYGAAVDLTIAKLDANGYRPLDMGTDYDHFGPLAQPRYEDKFLKEKKLTAAQVKNRKLLRTIMLKSGFHMIMSEWWHFNSFPINIIKKKYKIIE